MTGIERQSTYSVITKILASCLILLGRWHHCAAGLGHALRGSKAQSFRACIIPAIQRLKKAIAIRIFTIKGWSLAYPVICMFVLLAAKLPG